jgi:virulence factor Mce-like protein
MRRLLAIACFGVIVAVALVVTGCGASSATGGDQYRVDALFDNASFLIPGQDVRVAGANVGSVTAVKVTPDRKARISMRIDKRFAPFHADADCFIAPQSLIGERFIQCAPGTPRAKALRSSDGHAPTVPVTNTHSPVDPDLVTATFTLPVRERLSIILNELGAGLAGNGPALSNAIRRANPAIGATQDVLRIVDRDRDTLGRLVDRSDQVIAQLARRRDRVGAFIREAADVSQTAAVRDRAISEGIRRLPGTLDETRSSLAALRTLANRARPLVGRLHEAAQPLDSLVSQTPGLADAARPALRHLASMSRTGTTTLREGAPVVKRLRTFARLAVPAGDLVTQLNESLRERGVVEGIQSFVYTAALAISRYDKDSHILPSYPVADGDCAVFSEKTEPACDAHLTKGSATARAHTRARTRTRHRAKKKHRRAKRPRTEQRRETRPEASKPDAPKKNVLDEITGAIDKLTHTPPPSVPKLPPPPKAPQLPQQQAPQPPQDTKGLLDYLLGS